MRGNNFNRIVNIYRIGVRVFPRKIRMFLLLHHMRTMGKKGQVIRCGLLKTLAKECGDNVRIFQDVYLSHVEGLSLGSNISIHPMSHIDAAGEVSIADNVSIAHGVTILSTSHKFSDISIPIREQGYNFMKTTIQNNVWIGAKATILCGTTLETGCIIAANSVVTKDVHKNTIVGGCPAKLIKTRG